MKPILSHHPGTARLSLIFQGLSWILIAVCLAACTPAGFSSNPATAFSEWKPADLRFLQAVGTGVQPGLVAVYTRQTVCDLEIRFDFLDLLAQPVDFDLYLALDTRAGGTTTLPIDASAGLAWETLIKVPSAGSAVALDDSLAPLANLIPRYVDDPRQAIRVIQINRTNLPGNPSQPALQVFLTRTGQTAVIQQTPPIQSGIGQPARAPLLLVFWDTLPAATPAQALRRWDGAHTGPIGGRHGLSVLVQAASAYQVPLVLADLKQPSSLAALVALGKLPVIQAGSYQGSLLLPDPSTGDSQSDSLLPFLGQVSDHSFGLSASPFSYAPFTNPLPENSGAVFAVLSDSHHLQNWQGHLLIPLPAAPGAVQSTDDSAQVSIGGLSLPVRQALLAAALSPDPADLVVLGGSLPASAWGDFSVASPVFEYIANHPWIQPLTASDLLKLPAEGVDLWPVSAGCADLLCTPASPDVIPYTSAGGPVPSGISSLKLKIRLEQQLADLAPSPLADQAKQMLRMLTTPTSDPSLAALRANYLGQVGYLLEAARWDVQPDTRASCAADLDFDGITECVLASPDWLLIIKTDGARLVFAANRSSSRVSQWVGPASQFAAGLSDPSTWQPKLGPAADPYEIPGGFALLDRPFEPAQVEIQAQKMVFTSNSSTRTTYQLNGTELWVEVASPQPISTRLPIPLAPQRWPSEGPVSRWLPPPRLDGSSWMWTPALGDGLRIDFAGTTALTAISFLDTLDLLKVPEDPDRNYPPGHFIPFPLAVIDIQGTSFQVHFKTIESAGP